MVSRPPTQITPPPHGLRYRRDGQAWDGSFMVGKRRLRRRLGTIEELAYTDGGRRRTDDQVTRELLRLWDVRAAELQQELDSRVGEKRAISVVFGEWHEQRQVHGLKEATVEMHHKLLAKQWASAVGDHPLNEIGLSKIDRYKAWMREQGLGPVTINMRLTRLRTFLHWCQKRGYIEQLPEIEKVPEPVHVPTAPIPQQIRKLFDRIHGLMRSAPSKELRYWYELHEAALVLAPCTAMRRGELTRLEWERISLTGKIAYLVDTKERTEGKPVAIGRMAIDYLKRRRKRYPKHKYVFQAFKLGKPTDAYPKGEPLLAYPDPHSLTTAGRRHMRAVGIVGWKPWAGLRNFFATMGLDELGIDAQAVSAQLGHSTVKTTEKHYQTSRTQSKLRAVRQMEPALRRAFGRKVVGRIAGRKRKRAKSA